MNEPAQFTCTCDVAPKNICPVHGAKSDHSSPTPETDKMESALGRHSDTRTARKEACDFARKMEVRRDSLERCALTAEAESKRLLQYAQKIAVASDTLTTTLHASEAKRVAAERLCLVKGNWEVGFQEGFAAAKAHLSEGKVEMFMGGGPRYSVLMTGPNHGIVNPIGETFPSSPDYYERTVMVRSELLDAALTSAQQAQVSVKELEGRLEEVQHELNDLMDFQVSEHRRLVPELPLSTHPIHSVIAAYQEMKSKVEATNPLCAAAVAYWSAFNAWNGRTPRPPYFIRAQEALLECARAYAQASADPAESAMDDAILKHPLVEKFLATPASDGKETL